MCRSNTEEGRVGEDGTNLLAPYRHDRKLRMKVIIKSFEGKHLMQESSRRKDVRLVKIVG